MHTSIDSYELRCEGLSDPSFFESMRLFWGAGWIGRVVCRWAMNVTK